MTEETITIPKRQYESLLDDSDKLAALEAFGVDNWCGWDEAMKEYHENKELTKEDT